MTDYPCPYCPKACEDSGPDGLAYHVLTAHPLSELAVDIQVEIAELAWA